MVIADEPGLMPSELLLGGVRRLPTLVKVVAGGAGWVVGYELEYFCGSPTLDGGGSSKLGRCEAFGLRDVKLVGAPIGSCPGTIEMGYATAAATLPEW